MMVVYHEQKDLLVVQLWKHVCHHKTLRLVRFLSLHKQTAPRWSLVDKYC